MVQLACMELNRDGGHPVTSECELEELIEVPFHDGVSCFHEISHLEIVLHFEDDGHEFLEQLTLFQDKVLHCLCLEDLDELSDKVGDIGNPGVSGLENGMSDTCQVSQTLGSLHLDLRGQLIPNVHLHYLKQTLQCVGVLYHWSPTCGNVRLLWLIQTFIKQYCCEVI